MDDATQSLENGDLEGAKAKYEESLGIQETSAAWFNLGVSLLLSWKEKRADIRYASITLVSLSSFPLPLPFSPYCCLWTLDTGTETRLDLDLLQRL